MSTSASGTSPVGRGTSGAAAASSGGLSPLSIYGFPFVASVCSVCSPDALRAHTHTHLHTQTHARTTTDWRLRGNVPVTAGGESLVYEKLVAVLVFSVSSNFRGCGCSQARSEQRERFSTKFPWRPLTNVVSAIETGPPVLQNKTGVAIETAQNRLYAADNLISATSYVRCVNFTRVVRRGRCHRGACKILASSSG